VLEANAANGVLQEGLYWDTERPYHYLRADRTEDGLRLIVGGEDRRTGQDPHAARRFADLRTFIGELLPNAKLSVQRQWSGEVLESIDGLPFIGRAGRNLYVATGFGGNGMTFGVASALINRDLIMGTANIYERLFSPRRIGGWERLPTRLASAFEGLVGRRVTRSHVSFDAIVPGEGAVVDDGGKKIAAYRAPDGRLLRLSAACTHMGCIVQWNTAGKSWDCPCHGSRFTPEGSVMHGPAIRPLDKSE
jgi:nitrite reductase/ring-hydroxylating ferredoxin subunit